MLSLSSLIKATAAHRIYSGWDFANISSCTDSAWNSLPILTAEGLRQCNTQDPVCGDTDCGEIHFYSSGTTGEPKIIHLSRRDMDRIGELCRRFSRNEGIGALSRVMVLLPMAFWGVGKITQEGHRLNNAHVFPVNLQGDAGYWNRLAEEIKPTVISSTPSVLAAWAPRYQGPPLELVETTGEPLLYHERYAIEQAFGARVHDAYGLSECVVGVECSEHMGFHFWPDAVHVEIMDPESDTPLPVNTTGEVVVTSFMQERLPIIRYRTGDLGRILPFPCPCGSELPLLFFEGRIEETLYMPRGVQIERQELLAALQGFGCVADIRWKGKPGSPAESIVRDSFIPALEVQVVPHQKTDPDKVRENILRLLPELGELIYEKEIRLDIVERL